MNDDFVLYHPEYGEPYVTNDVLSHILSIYPFVLKELALEGGKRGREVGVLDLQSRSEALRLSCTLTNSWINSR